MKLLGRSSMLVVAALLAAGPLNGVAAQTPPAGPAAPGGYDVKTEVTLEGTVEAVETVTGMMARGRHARGGMHLTLKTDAETLQVHLGPIAYLAEKGVAVAKGDTLEVVGSRVTMDGGPVVIARQITKGDRTWTFRDASGRPLWSGPRS
jgi:hypothetical protein